MDENKTLDKIIAGLKIAEKEFLEKKAANNETIILSDKDGKIIEVPAKDLKNLISNTQIKSIYDNPLDSLNLFLRNL